MSGELKDFPQAVGAKISSCMYGVLLAGLKIDDAKHQSMQYAPLRALANSDTMGVDSMYSDAAMPKFM